MRSKLVAIWLEFSGIIRQGYQKDTRRLCIAGMGQ
jgi:hypothetical protein